MRKFCWLVFISSAIHIIMSAYIDKNPVYLPNLDRPCLRCLCLMATGCNLTFGCVAGYCGPYKISRVYWIDANRLVMDEDDPERAGAYEDCANNYVCARSIVQNYFIKYARDCNEDGVTDCEDYMMMNFNGGYQCQPPLNRNEAGRQWLEKFNACDPRGKS